MTDDRQRVENAFKEKLNKVLYPEKKMTKTHDKKDLQELVDVCGSLIEVGSKIEALLRKMGAEKERLDGVSQSINDLACQVKEYAELLEENDETSI